LLIVLTLPPSYRCPLDRLPASRLLLPRSALERSDFVRWHFSEVPALMRDVRSLRQTGSSGRGGKPTRGPKPDIDGIS
jgi:hypothetical protein